MIRALKPYSKVDPARYGRTTPAHLTRCQVSAL